MPHISLANLEDHPLNANRMNAAMFAKLAAHIRATGQYPALIVRRLDDRSNHDALARFQILDGHHRLRALRQLGYEHARCDIWEVDDDHHAVMLLLTLNRLRGSDDPAKRASLVQAALSNTPFDVLARALPEQRDRIEAMLEVASTSNPLLLLRPSPNEADMPVAVTFFLKPIDRDALLEHLRAIDPDRSVALMKLSLAGGSE